MSTENTNPENAPAQESAAAPAAAETKEKPRKKQRSPIERMIVWGLILTIVFGAAFLGIKWQYEYLPKWEHHLVPGEHFDFQSALAYKASHGDGHAVPDLGGVTPKGVEIFFCLYFVMTGMHALHMVVGIGIMLVMIPLAWRGHWTPQNHNFVEGFGLYWHFVDIVWIFLFPFLYLLGLAGTH